MKKTAIAAILALGMLPAAPTAAADDTVATVQRPTPVDAFAGRLAWSAYDPARGYLLMTRLNGVTSEVPVKPRSVPFDVDLGPDQTGETVAVFSRCRRDPPPRRPQIGSVLTQMPDWARGRGCNVRKFHFGTGRETSIAAASSRRASEYLPSIWHERVAFSRTYERRDGIAGLRPYLYVRALVGRGRSRRIPAGSRSTLRFCSGAPKRCRRLVEPGPTALALSGRALAFGWDSGGEIGATSALHLQTLRGRIERKRLTLGTSGDIQAEQVVGAALDSGRVWWGFTRFGDETSNVVRRYSISTRRRDQAPLPAPAAPNAFRQSVLWTTADQGQVTYLLSGLTVPGEPCTPQAPCTASPGCSAREPCSIRTATGLAFSRYSEPRVGAIPRPRGRRPPPAQRSPPTR